MSLDFRILTLTFLSPLLLFATTDPSSALALAFRNADAAAVSRQMEGNLNLTILDKEGNYSKTQATMLIREFMEQHPVKTFTVQHTGSSTQGSGYGIAEMTGTDGASYRVTFVFKKSGEQQVLRELVITTTR